MRFSITTEVDAPPDVVFAVLSDVERWPEWTPTVTRVERVKRLGDAGAPLALGSRLRIVQPKVPPAEWTVTAFEPNRGFRLFSRSPGATVEADHWAEPAGAGDRSRVTLSVTFAGFLGRVIGWMMRGLNERYLAQEAAGLKRRSEERARAGGEAASSAGPQAVPAEHLPAGQPDSQPSVSVPMIDRPAVYREVIDALVHMCKEGQGQIGANRVRSGVWNRNATSPDFSEDQYAYNQLLARLGARDREVIARMLEEEVVTGVFEALKALQEHEIAPFEDGYEGGPFQDFIGRLDGWEWPT